MILRLSDLPIPTVQAPMAGGPSTPELAAAVSAGGGLGFLAAGYRTVEGVAAEIAAVRAATPRPFGVNLFVPATARGSAPEIAAYAESLRPEAERYGVTLGEPRFDDDAYAEKLALVLAERVPVVSFTFGAPARETVAALHAAGTAVWVTVTDTAEAATASALSADALIAQGTEAGGHRGYFDDFVAHEELGVLALLNRLRQTTQLPLVAAGGIMDGAGIATALTAGAAAAQMGTAFMLTPEAGTSPTQRAWISRPGATGLTRAFSGRTARGIVNRFSAEHSAGAPRAYPEINHLTAPIRAASRDQGDGEALNLWAGEGHAQARELPAGMLVAELWSELHAARREWPDVSPDSADHAPARP